MNRNLTLNIVALAILLFIARYDLNYLKYKAPMPYSDWDKITWNDFLGLRKPYHTIHGEKKIAFISTEIAAEYIGDRTFQIITYFHPSRSYVFSRNIADKRLLQHELYHLHITERFSRLMRQEILMHAGNKTFDLSECLTTYQQQEDSMQREYDSDTYHGFLLSKQKLWQINIDSSLLAMKNFSNTIVKTK